MTIQKDQQKIVNFMIEKSYSGVIRRTILIYVFHDIDEIKSTLSVTGLPVEMSAWDKFLYKQKVIKDTLQTDKAKDSLLFGLKKTALKKSDLISEILTQYSIANSDETTDFHDQMCTIFDRHMETIKEFIIKGDYKTLARMMEIKEGS